MRAGMRRAGAVAMTLGLLLSVLGVVAAAATPAAALEDTSGLVCNNQKDRDDQDCEGANAHGEIATSFDIDGNLLFDIDATGDFGGWKQIYICIPGTEKTNRADCQGNTASVLHPQPPLGGDYDVTTPATNTENDKDVTFACATSIDAKVFAAALPTSSSFTWTVHVNTCGGGTDEAFGTATRTPPQGDDFTYECLPASGVTQTTATLRGATNDEDVDTAVFSFTAPAEDTRTFTDDDDTDGFSVDVDGLTANTVYEYSVDFSAGDEPAGTGAGCGFTTDSTPDTYACAAPSDVTATSATLHGSTSNGEVDSAMFDLTPDGGDATTPIAGIEQGNSNSWSAVAAGLSPATRYTYTVRFLDGTDLAGTGSGDVCAFTTGAAVAGVVETRTAPEPEAAVAPAAAAPVAVAGAELPRTGIETDLLLPLGLALVLLGLAAVTLSGGRESQLVIVVDLLRRPEGEHYR